MTKINEFNKKLNKLFEERTHWLRSAVKRAPQGHPPFFTRAKVDKSIEQLQDIASEILIHQVSKTEFNKIVLQKKRWHTKNKGRGWDKKEKEFNLWFKSNINFNNYVYVFEAGKRCRYVGRSIAGKTRPQTHFEKRWINGVTIIKIFSTSQPSQIPKLECLAIHKFDPPKKYNKNTPSFSKNDKPCPICETKELIRKELKSIFKLR